MIISSFTDEPLTASNIDELYFLSGPFSGDRGDLDISSNDETLFELSESSTMLTLFLDIYK